MGRFKNFGRTKAGGRWKKWVRVRPNSLQRGRGFLFGTVDKAQKKVSRGRPDDGCLLGEILVRIGSGIIIRV